MDGSYIPQGKLISLHNIVDDNMDITDKLPDNRAMTETHKYENKNTQQETNNHQNHPVHIADGYPKHVIQGNQEQQVLQDNKGDHQEQHPPQDNQGKSPSQVVDGHVQPQNPLQGKCRECSKAPNIHIAINNQISHNDVITCNDKL